MKLSHPREPMFIMALLDATDIPADTVQAFNRAAVTAAGPGWPG